MTVLSDKFFTHPFSGRITVTAADAASMLARNHDNRPLSAGRVRGMAEKMDRLKALRLELGREPSEEQIVSADAWLWTHQGIGFDVSGVLVDGQHRLAAQIRADITLDWNVTTMLAKGAFDRTDVGDVRSASDLLARRCPSLKNRSAVASGARFALLGLRGHDVDKVTVVDFVEANEAMCVSLVSSLRRNEVTSRAAVAGAFIAAVRRFDDPFPGPKGARHIDLVTICAERLANQEWISRKDDPLKTLHTRLVADERAAHRSGRSTDPRTIYGYVVAAIRAELAGRGIATVQGTDVDWGDPTDQIREGTGDLGAKRAAALSKAWTDGKFKPNTAGLDKHREAKQQAQPAPTVRR